MQNHTKNTKNLDSNIQHIEISDVITKSVNQHEILPLIFGVRNWIMDWTTINYRNHKSRSLPELIFEDADLFFHMYENNFFRGYLAKEAEVLYRRARSIRVPSRNGQKMLVEYLFHPDGKFGTMQLIPDGSDIEGLIVSQWIDFYVPRSHSHFDKTGYENFVMGLKSILFNNPVLRMYSHNWNEFFDDEDNFDLRRVEEMES